ncbi:choice-of-anchor I family protein [Luteipulveratus flavus]|uniref:Choice-of-anchor I family protein n=1 Tax=Luteipulveratus flavus TaxID=3031728 RepID=A0ABT6C704_9MICO|nr:choice-of-anchor I family protein [Luteipulveratus sp. YIM 133296]MDF8263859.1 choice-of-anchor I family protein [Luteipulveratus sp. YIM 133296]
MRLRTVAPSSVALSLALAAGLCAPSALADQQAPALMLQRLGSHETGVFDRSAAEITAYDARHRLIYAVNAESGAVDVLDAADPRAPRKVGEIDVAGVRAADGSTVPDGSQVNSVHLHGGSLAVAVESATKTDRGWALLYATGRHPAYVAGVRVGAQPDMITITDDGRNLLTANEAEPADDFSADPEGSISVVRLRGESGRLAQSDVRTAGFGAWDNGRSLPAGVRVFGPDVPVPAGQPAAGRVARNLEPEYLAVSGDRAYVTLQEANAVGVLDLRTATITDVWPMPDKDWSAGDNVLDASDKDDAIALQHWPVHGLAMPDTIASYETKGKTYLVTANEGDAREWGSYAEPIRVKDKAYQLCPDVFPNAADLKKDAALGRLNVSRATGLRAGAGCYERIEAFGGRSFSILTPDGTQVFESGGQIEQQIARLVAEGVLPRQAFNANHTANPSFDTRSDDKGPEPEGVTVGRVGARTYAFIGLERVGGVMVYDITDPTAPTYVTYANARSWDAVFDGEPVPGMGDLGAEGVEFVPAAQSPTGRPMVIVANEVSGSTTTFEVTVS